MASRGHKRGKFSKFLKIFFTKTAAMFVVQRRFQGLWGSKFHIYILPWEKAEKMFLLVE